MRHKHSIMAAVLLTLSLLSAGPASAADEAPGAQAQYMGRTINLAVDWEGAQACAAYSETDIRCYSSPEEMVAEELAGIEEQLSYPEQIAERGKSDCPGGRFSSEWTCLFDYTYWGGRMLKFRDGYCQNLDSYGFSNRTASFVNTLPYNFTLYDASSCLGETRSYSRNSASSTLGSFNNRASSIRIAR